MAQPHLTVRPIDAWPDPPTRNRRRAPFSATESSTMGLLTHELSMLGAKFGVIELVMDSGGIRLDGQLRAAARPDHPGVVLHLETRHGPLRLACDTFAKYQDNLRAIALTLEALRKIDRYGTAQTGQQYTGWLQLEAGPAPMTRNEAEAVIRAVAGEAYATAPISRAIRAATRVTHPDAGGDREAYDRVVQAKAAIEAAR